MKRTKILILFLFLYLPLNSIISQSGSALTFNEILFYPVETNGEFVEIYNTSATQSIDISGFKFKYYTSSPNNLVPVSGGTLLGPGGFAVILQGNYDYVNGIYKTLIPAGTIIMKTSGSNFGSSGMANTTGREVSLLNNAGEIVETYNYTANNTAGISDEKIIPDKNNTTVNWSNGNIVNGTPGRKNSVSPVDYDLVISFKRHIPQIVTAGNSLFLEFVIRNQGRLRADSFSFEVYYDSDRDSIEESNEAIYTLNNSILPDDSLQIPVPFYPQTSGEYIFIGKINFAVDERSSNNTTFIKITVSDKLALHGEIVINEIMYAPLGDEPEWIELYNNSERSINLKNWRAGDKTATVLISATDYELTPSEYLVISKETVITELHNITSRLLIRSLPTLSNSGDDVLVSDLYGRIMDSVKYLPSWGGNSGGRSLERKSADTIALNQSNWGSSTSINRSTPGRVNSISEKEFDLEIASVITVNQFAEIGKNFNFTVWIKNSGNAGAVNFNLILFRDKNFNRIGEADELISSTSIESLESDHSKSIQLICNDFETGSNQFIVFLDYPVDQFTENNSFVFNINGVELNEVRGDIVINEIMYAPHSPEPEWIEIFNRSSKIINLKNYIIGDNSSYITITDYDFMLQPEEYAVVSKDSVIFSIYGNLGKTITAVIPSLNDGGDRIVLLDSLGRIIDSTYYSPAWGGSSGRSLERIAAEKSSTDSTNWKTTKAERGTPGRINSISKKNYDIALMSESINPAKPVIGQEVRINIHFRNPGKNPARFICRFYEKLNNGIKLLLKEEYIEVPSIEDTGFYFSQMEFIIESLTAKRTFEYFADYKLDEDTTNNRYQFSVIPGYPKNSVVLNEIMYNPVNGEPEWIELFNRSAYDIDLEGWSISDFLTTPLKTKLQSGGITVPAGTFLVISKDSVINNFHRSIPSQLLINTFANLNNDADAVIIRDANEETIDSVRYDKSWGGENGKSLERISITGTSGERLNWGSSTDIELSTPGRINGLAPKDYDLTISGISIVPLYASFGEDVSIAANVFNNGTKIADHFTVQFYFITGNDTSFYSNGSGSNLSAKDSVLILSSNRIKLDNPRRVYCKIIFEKDLDNHNNFYVADVNSGYGRNTVLINEIMYNPLAGEPEWIEIVNCSSEPVNLKGWKISDLLPLPIPVLISSQDVILNPGSYAVITTDTASFMFYPPENFLQVKFGSLGNTSEGILINDFRGAIIDSILYSSKWGGAKGFSIERRAFNKSGSDSTNWMTSINRFGATPGFRNSVTEIPELARDALVINEIMFDPAEGNCEFIELLNTTSDSIQAGGMNLLIGPDKRFPLSQSYFNLAPGRFLVFARDSTIEKNYSFAYESNFIFNSSLGLSNDGSYLVLIDAHHKVIDSVNYNSGWHNRNITSTKNRSLERLNPYLDSNDRSNWSSSVAPEGATPGKENSVFAETIASETNVKLIPNPFSPDSDGHEDFTTINFNLSRNLAQVRICVYDSRGRKVRTLNNNNPAGPNNSLIFDGMDENGRPLRIGIYILLIEIVTDSGETEKIKTPVVIARKL